MPTVYRIQHETIVCDYTGIGLGPLSTQACSYFGYNLYFVMNDPMMPAPELDGIPDLQHLEVCACADKTQLAKWFSSCYNFLHEKGFVLATIKAKKVRYGHTQCVFNTTHDYKVIKTVRLAPHHKKEINTVFLTQL
jgi:hypothetical protein